MGSFFDEFTKFETQSVANLLRGLSGDPDLVEQSEEILDLESRLTLIKRLASSRALPIDLLADLDLLIVRATELHIQRNELVRNVESGEKGPAKSAADAEPRKLKSGRRRLAQYARVVERNKLWIPTEAQVREYLATALDLQSRCTELTDKIRKLSDSHQTPI